MTRKPAATIKSRPTYQGRRAWYTRCLLHAEPAYIGMFGARVSYLIAGREKRESALSLLELHQRQAHHCTGCAGLDCPRCRGTGVDLTTTKD